MNARIFALSLLFMLTACERSQPVAFTPQAVAAPGESQRTQAEHPAEHSNGEHEETTAASEPSTTVTSGHRCTGECARPVGQGDPRRNVVVVTETPSTETFGAPPTGAELVDAEAVFADPRSFAGRKVRLEGTVERVCQRMGCWMELHSGARTLRVPMAGHAFFLPRDCAGRRASVEGIIQVAELPPEMRAHLESEGAQNTQSHIELHATSVVLEVAAN